MQQRIIIFTAFLLFTACAGREQSTEQQRGPNKYAHGFRMKSQGDLKQLTVFDPWEKAGNVRMEYLLMKRGTPLPDSLKGETVIRTPVERVICLSTTHLAFLNALDETGAVVGISGSRYVSNAKIRRRMEAGEVPDVGYGQNLNYEQIVAQKPGLVMVYGVGSEITGITRKLHELGIPSVVVAEYLEEKPLGKAEWLKFFGAFFEKETLAKTRFSAIEKNYLELKEMERPTQKAPRVLVGSPYNDSWWVPGGNSYMANLIADAGGDYLGKANSSNESYVISFENALAWGSRADVWINMGNLASKEEILAADGRFKNLRVFREGRIFNNIKRNTPHGGNDFWESGTVNPHLILKDLMIIFYPQQMKTDSLTYYQPVQQ